MKRTILGAVAIAALTITNTPSANAEAGNTNTPWFPCTSDEGPDGQGITHCVWDSRHMGNGKGHSFLITKDCKLKVIKHRRAHKMLRGAGYGWAPEVVAMLPANPCS